uniref:Putative VirB9 n=1 Tax=Pseudomonas savastanoi pv. fraxini TaxID=360922 RepID=E6Z1Y6_PSESS|nr:putative VirB9 [Pseudomonas savastanoi pv. fraxini]
MGNKAVSGLAALLALTCVVPALAESLGTGSSLDRRVQTAVYSPDNVYRIQASVGRTSLVQLPANETINEASGLMVSGDPKAWSIGPNAVPGSTRRHRNGGRHAQRKERSCSAWRWPVVPLPLERPGCRDPAYRSGEHGVQLQRDHHW